MKVIVGIPVGTLFRMGYQYHSEMVLDNMSTYFDKVIVVSSSRETTKLPIDKQNITLVSNENTWFKLKENGEEQFDWDTLIKNVNLLLKLAKCEGGDVIVIKDINSYIDIKNNELFRIFLNDFRTSNNLFEYLFFSYQILEQISFPAKAKPFVINLKHKDYSKVRISFDSIYIEDKKYPFKNFHFKNAPYHFNDVVCNFNEIDHIVRDEFYQKYERLRAKKLDITYSWSELLASYPKKNSNMVINPNYRKNYWYNRAVGSYPKDALPYIKYQQMMGEFEYLLKNNWLMRNLLSYCRKSYNRLTTK